MSEHVTVAERQQLCRMLAELEDDCRTQQMKKCEEEATRLSAYRQRMFDLCKAWLLSPTGFVRWIKDSSEVCISPHSCFSLYSAPALRDSWQVYRGVNGIGDVWREGLEACLQAMQELLPDTFTAEWHDPHSPDPNSERIVITYNPQESIDEIA